jgi:hypothetical protein
MLRQDGEFLSPERTRGIPITAISFKNCHPEQSEGSAFPMIREKADSSRQKRRSE